MINKLRNSIKYTWVLASCTVVILFIQSCQPSSINGVVDNSREYVQFTQFYVDKNFIHTDTALQIVFRNEEDERTFFEEHPIKSRFPFPGINYEYNDVVGICLGRREARGAYVTIDSVILNEQSEIEVYSTEFDFETKFPTKNYPIKFLTIPKFWAPFVFTNFQAIKMIEPQKKISFVSIQERIPNIISDTIVAKTIRSTYEEREFISGLTEYDYQPRWNINYEEEDLIAIVIDMESCDGNSIQIDEIFVINREVTIVTYEFKYIYNYAPITQQYATIPKFGFPVEFIERN